MRDLINLKNDYIAKVNNQKFKREDLLNNYIKYLESELKCYKDNYYTNPVSIYKISYLEQSIEDLNDIRRKGQE